MSVNLPGGGQKADPNLTPLLDMVLQLIMFFMLCANFVMDQVNETIKLPLAIEAKALDKTQDGYIVLNVNPQGKVLLGRDENAETLETPVAITNYMRNQFELDKARTKPAAPAGPTLASTPVAAAPVAAPVAQPPR